MDHEAVIKDLTEQRLVGMLRHENLLRAQHSIKDQIRQSEHDLIALDAKLEILHTVKAGA